MRDLIHSKSESLPYPFVRKYIIPTYIVEYPTFYMLKGSDNRKKIQKSIQKLDNNGYGETSFSPALERKIKNITTGIRSGYFNVLHAISYHNASTISDYIIAMTTETNLSDHYRQDNIPLFF